MLSWQILFHNKTSTMYGLTTYITSVASQESTQCGQYNLLILFCFKILQITVAHINLWTIFYLSRCHSPEVCSDYIIVWRRYCFSRKSGRLYCSIAKYNNKYYSLVQYIFAHVPIHMTVIKKDNILCKKYMSSHQLHTLLLLYICTICSGPDIRRYSKLYIL